MRRRPFLSAAALFISALFLYASWNLLTSPYEPRLEAFRRQGLPTTLGELNLWYSPVPPEQNNAQVCEYAYFQLRGTRNILMAFHERSGFLKSRKAPQAEDRESLTGLLRTNKEALELFHSLNPTGSNRYAVDLNQGAATMLPHLGRVREATALLVIEALVHSAEGKTDKAIESLEVAGRVADTLKQEPVLVSQQVRLTCWDYVPIGLEPLLNHAALNDAQLQRLQTLLAGASSSEGIMRGLAGELAFGAALFNEESAQYLIFNNSSSGPGSEPPVGVTLALNAYKASGVFRRDRAFFLDHIKAQMEAARLPLPASLKRMRELQSEAENHRFFLMSRAILPAFSHGFTRNAEVSARLLAAQAALAVERYRRAHGEALPERLEQLVPALLPAVPTDPYDDAPLRYKKLPAGYVVYSIGEDRKDDGGVEPLPKKRGVSQDIVFLVER
jgi:hypothetical protein